MAGSKLLSVTQDDDDVDVDVDASVSCPLMADSNSNSSTNNLPKEMETTQGWFFIIEWGKRRCSIIAKEELEQEK